MDRWNRQPWGFLAVGVALYFGVAAAVLAVLGPDRPMAASIAGMLAAIVWTMPSLADRFGRRPGAVGPSTAARRDADPSDQRPLERSLATTWLAAWVGWALCCAVVAYAALVLFRGDRAAVGYAIFSAALLWWAMAGSLRSRRST